ncbi:MAG: hypothetical protein E7F71_13245 [Clostridium perfringens]|nr:hypothetical protein [Clostridium perfringens]
MFKIKDCKKFMKKCNNCGEVKIINKFYRKRSNKDGYFKICTSCYRKRYKHICITCKKEFSSSNKHQKFCSKKCEGINNRGENNPNYKNAKLYIGANHPSWKGGDIYYNCEYCGKQHHCFKSAYDKRKHHFCSQKCKWKWQSENLIGENHPKYNRKFVKCEICKKEIEVPNYRLNKQDHFYCSQRCHNIGHGMFYSKENHPLYGTRISEETKIKISKANTGKFIGSKSPRWNPELTAEEREKNASRHSEAKYRKWFKAVFEKDNYTCVCCSKKGGEIVSHHLNGWNWCKEQRYDVKNGVTLCKECHVNFHKKYGYGDNTINQFKEFIK